MKGIVTDSVADRLERLERENRRMKHRGRLTLIGIVAVVAAGADAGNLIEAERFVLKDKDGLKHAELAVDASGSSSLRFFDRFGTVRLRLGVDAAQDGVSKDAALLSVCDDTGRDRIVTQVNLAGASQFTVADEDGKDRLAIVTDEGTHSVSLEIVDRKDARRFSLIGQEAGDVAMHFEDIGPAPRLSLYADQGGPAGLTIYDNAEKSRFVLETPSEGDASFRFLDKDGHSLMTAPKP